MSSDSLELHPHILFHRGGRTIAWHEFGCSDNPQLTALYCHGTPGSGYEALFFDQAARRLGVRIIAPDRPGLGGSDHVDERSVDSWVKDDLEAILEHLGLDTVSLIGFSGGGPHAMGIAAHMPTRVQRLVLLAPFTYDRFWGSRLGLKITPVRIYASHLIWSWFPQGLIDVVSQGLGRVLTERFPLVQVLASQAGGRSAAYWLALAHDYALQGGIGGGVQDEYAIQGNWGFSEATLKVPVDIWIAGKDRTVKPGGSRNLGLRLGATMHHLPSEGHLSLLVNHAQEILTALLGASHTPDALPRKTEDSSRSCSGRHRPDDSQGIPA